MKTALMFIGGIACGAAAAYLSLWWYVIREEPHK
jgi:hypothetical protein